VPHTSTVSFFHSVLDQRLVDYREHFFWGRFGCGQKTRAQTGDWENSFAYGVVAHDDPYLWTFL
jgi:hypothetical protein